MSNPYRMTDQGYGVASFKSGGAFLFDEIDLPLIEQHTWHLGKRGYPATHYHGRTVVFHRLLFPDSDGEVDHINGDKMDNRRCNLRICTHQQNAFNQKRRCTNTSCRPSPGTRPGAGYAGAMQALHPASRAEALPLGFIGVSAVRDAPFYEAYIHLHGRKHHLGTFSDPKQAARTRDAVARLVFGEYARLNYPKGSRRLTNERGQPEGLRSRVPSEAQSALMGVVKGGRRHGKKQV